MMRELRGLLIPFRRDKKRDFASGTGAELLQSKVRQVLLTMGATPRSSGELKWRTTFGAGLDRLRHQRNTTALADVARVYVRDALRRWLPSVQVTAVDVQQDANRFTLRVQVREGGTAAAVDVDLGD